MDLYLSLKIPVSHRIPGLVDVERICVVFLQEFCMSKASRILP